MSGYRVTWIIDLEAETAEDVARDALAIQRDTSSIATVFDVQEIGPGLQLGEKVRVDLLKLAEDIEADQVDLEHMYSYGMRPR